MPCPFGACEPYQRSAHIQNMWTIGGNNFWYKYDQKMKTSISNWEGSYYKFKIWGSQDVLWFLDREPGSLALWIQIMQYSTDIQYNDNQWFTAIQTLYACFYASLPPSLALTILFSHIFTYCHISARPLYQKAILYDRETTPVWTSQIGSKGLCIDCLKSKMSCRLSGYTKSERPRVVQPSPLPLCLSSECDYCIAQYCHLHIWTWCNCLATKCLLCRMPFLWSCAKEVMNNDENSFTAMSPCHCLSTRPKTVWTNLQLNDPSHSMPNSMHLRHFLHSCHMQKAIEQHGCMAHGQYEAISVHPLWRVRVVVQDPLVQLMAPSQRVSYREGMRSYETLYFTASYPVETKWGKYNMSVIIICTLLMIGTRYQTLYTRANYLTTARKSNMFMMLLL